MKMYFCKCGQAVTEAEINVGIAVRLDDRVLCFRCMPGGRPDAVISRPAVEAAAPPVLSTPAPVAPAPAAPATGPDAAAEVPREIDTTATPLGGTPVPAAAAPATGPDAAAEPVPETDTAATPSEGTPVPTVPAATLSPAVPAVAASIHPASASAARRRMGGGSASGSRQRAQESGADADGEAPPEGLIARWNAYTGSDKAKFISLTISALFVLAGIIVFFARGGCHIGEKAKVNVIETAVSRMLMDARQLNSEAMGQMRAGQYKEAETKFYASQELYWKVLDEVRKRGLIPEEQAEAQSYEYIDDECTRIGPNLRTCKEEILKAEERLKGRYQDAK